MRAHDAIFSSLAVTPAVAETTRLTVVLSPSGVPAPYSSIVKAGRVCTTRSTGSTRNDYASGQSCSCYSDSHDYAVCGVC
jgi:hypothetical protein